MTRSTTLHPFRIGNLAPFVALMLVGCAGSPQAPEFTLGDMTIEEYCSPGAESPEYPPGMFRSACTLGDPEADGGATGAATGINDRLHAGTISALVFCDRDATVSISWQHESGNVDKTIPCTDSADGSYVVVATLEAEIRTDVAIITPRNASTVTILMNDSISE